MRTFTSHRANESNSSVCAVCLRQINEYGVSWACAFINILLPLCLLTCIQKIRFWFKLVPNWENKNDNFIPHPDQRRKRSDRHTQGTDIWNRTSLDPWAPWKDCETERCHLDWRPRGLADVCHGQTGAGCYFQSWPILKNIAYYIIICIHMDNRKPSSLNKILN